MPVRLRVSPRDLLVWVAIAAAYVIGGRFGLKLAFVHASATAVWPPTGIAIASLLLCGTRFWSAILVGAFLVNIATGSVLSAAMIALGNTAEAVVAAALVNRYAGGARAFDRAQTFFRFVLYAVILSTTISPSVGVAALTLTGEAASSQAPAIWLTWWIGDAIGACLMAPVILLWAQDAQPRWRSADWLDAALIAGAVAISASIVFGGWLLGAYGINNLKFLCIPPCLWASLRFGARGAATAVLLLSFVALQGLRQTFAALDRATAADALLVAQLFMGVVAITAIVVGVLASERKRAQEAALASEQAARAQAEAANRQKDDFLAVLSHELRTPLNALMGWLQILKDRPVSADTRHAIEVMTRNAGALGRMIAEILDLSAIESGKLTLTLSTVDLCAAMRQAIESLNPIASLHDVTLEFKDPGDPVPIVGDPQRLQQILSNLISNAIKFTPAGGRVLVACACAKGEALVTVTDSGIGISPDVLPFIFDRFRQGDSSPTRGHGGLGLGLAVARHLARLHRGDVGAASPGTGHGSTFTLRLPLPGLATTTAAGRPGRVEVSGALAGLDILVVDDNDDARELLEAGLVKAGAHVRTASSADAALRMLGESAPHLLVADLSMPQVDGYTLIRRVRADGGLMPALAVTAHAGEDDRRRALDAGFNGHIAKPVELPDLVRQAARLTGRTMN